MPFSSSPIKQLFPSKCPFAGIPQKVVDYADSKSGTTEFKTTTLRRRDSIWECCEAGDMAGLKSILNKDRHAVDMRDGTGGRTPLHWACRNGRIDMVSLLLAERADPTVQTQNHQTCLHWTLIGGDYPEIVTLLLQHGADTTVRDKACKWTATDMARKKCRIASLTELQNWAGETTSAGNAMYDKSMSMGWAPAPNKTGQAPPQRKASNKQKYDLSAPGSSSFFVPPVGDKKK